MATNRKWNSMHKPNLFWSNLFANTNSWNICTFARLFSLVFHYEFVCHFNRHVIESTALPIIIWHQLIVTVTMFPWIWFHIIRFNALEAMKPSSACHAVIQRIEADAFTANVCTEIRMGRENRIQEFNLWHTHTHTNTVYVWINEFVELRAT